MEVKIGKKKFKLEKVSIYISDLYSEYVRVLNAPLTIDGDFEDIRLTAEIAREEADTKLDKLKASLRMIREAKELRKTNNESIAEGKILQKEILKEIVELNGYEYKEDEWIKHFSDTQFSELIDEVMGGKKKVTESST